ncbi:sulfurtransferase TusA family protein [Parasphingopyxis marina]|uniref:Sulfurtransferase TusA family protein n=1 Tax=Parasphingopyxis marina TaxID=2761622 RepID=A0A842HVK3_9SPHN|nr:sulfurtransferase TusA family protein [Parasphingopyxis marina]MBC2776935.1 sulfurtransferase TusA family protein [Parasphingopyxis marina]
MSGAGVDIDARGLKCPWPALRLARTMRTAESAVIVADDPLAPREIAALAAERGWTVGPCATAIGPGWRVFR